MPRRNTRLARTITAAPVFAALGDPVRLAVVARLCAEGPLPTVQLTMSAAVSRQAMTKHLNVLESVGLVSSDRVGRDRLWRMEERQLAQASAYLDVISKQWDAKLERLRAFVESDQG